MSNRGRIEFLERNSYRQRRFRDGARMLPLFAAVLMLLPLMWPREAPDQSLTSNSMIYLFGLWIMLVIVAYLLSKVLRFVGGDSDPESTKESGGASD